MNFDIANLVVNIGKQTQSFDCGSFFTALFGAGFGAWGAYYLNIKYERNKNTNKHYLDIAKFVSLLTEIRTSILNYKKEIELPKLKGYQEKNWKEAMVKYLHDKFDLPIDMNDYFFLVAKHYIFEALLYNLITYLKEFNIALEDHDKYVIKFIDRTTDEQLSELEQDQLKSLLDACVKTSDFALYFSDRLLKMLEQYPKKYPYKNFNIEISELPAEYNVFLEKAKQYDNIQSFEVQIQEYNNQPISRKTIYSDLKIFFTTYCVNCFNYFLPDVLYIKLKNKNKTGGRK